MIIKIPQTLLPSQLDTVDDVSIAVIRTDGQIVRGGFTKQAISLPGQSFRLSIPDEAFNKTQSIQITISVNGQKTETWYNATTKNGLIERSFVVQSPEAVPNTQRNKNTIYEDTPQERQLIGEMLEQQYQDAANLDTQPIGTKNLVYYVVGHKQSYVSLMAMSIASLASKWSSPVDIVVITDETMKQRILTNQHLASAIADFHVVEPIADGIAASALKTRIFEYRNIDQYQKILFLDCDIICKRDVNELFDQMHVVDKLVIACNASINFGSFRTYYHGLKQYSESQLQSMQLANILPFNAGQFLIHNTAAMKAHFAAVNWLMETWPGLYFFEQSFLNHYFCGFQTVTNQLSEYFDLISAANRSNLDSKHHRDQTHFIHFIAPALDGDAKIEFIQSYINAHQL